jgi:hypothetical protein
MERVVVMGRRSCLRRRREFAQACGVVQVPISIRSAMKGRLRETSLLTRHFAIARSSLVGEPVVTAVNTVLALPPSAPF